jgi:hypothetical protein
VERHLQVDVPRTPEDGVCLRLSFSTLHFGELSPKARREMTPRPFHSISQHRTSLERSVLQSKRDSVSTQSSLGAAGLIGVRIWP